MRSPSKLNMLTLTIALKLYHCVKYFQILRMIMNEKPPRRVNDKLLFGWRKKL